MEGTGPCRRRWHHKDLREGGSSPLEVTPLSTAGWFLQGHRQLSSCPPFFLPHTKLLAVCCKHRGESWMTWGQCSLWNGGPSCQPAFLWQASLVCAGILSFQMCPKAAWQPLYTIHTSALFPRGDLGTLAIFSHQNRV